MASEPWAWSGWEWATDGRFPGRWDDLHGNFRTVYADSSMRACLLEVLAGFRRDARLAAELDEIAEDNEDAALHPTLAPGQVPREWLDARAATPAELTGNYCAVTDSRSIAVLYPHFIGMALGQRSEGFTKCHQGVFPSWLQRPRPQVYEKSVIADRSGPLIRRENRSSACTNEVLSRSYKWNYSPVTVR